MKSPPRIEPSRLRDPEHEPFPYHCHASSSHIRTSTDGIEDRMHEARKDQMKNTLGEMLVGR